MATDNASQGTKFIKQAIEMDNAEEYEQALELYSNGIQCLIRASKEKKNKELIDIIKAKAMKYLQRGEEIKAILLNINKWTCNHLQKWIKSLNLNKNIEQKVVNAISDQEITGEDFNSMETYEDISQSFDINEMSAKQIYYALIKKKQINKAKKDESSNSCIIGLNNLGNTCFINSVIQCLLQTPGLIHILRTINKNQNCNMLNAFIELANNSKQTNTIHKSIAPKNIVKCLRNSDIKFRHNEQGDALSAVSKILELLDKNIIERTGQYSQHTGSWYAEQKSAIDEDELITKEWGKYNPNNGSIIRDYIHFIEKNTFICMECGWKELRYDIKDKILLPLKNCNMRIFIDIYIPLIKLNGPINNKTKKEFVVLDYCPIETLRYQIFEYIIQTIDNDEFNLKNINQISIHYLQPIEKEYNINLWINNCDEKQDCLNYKNQSLFAIINSFEEEEQEEESKMNEYITITIYNVFIDKNGMSNTNKSSVMFEYIKKGNKKIFNYILNEEYTQKYIYFDNKIFNGNYECLINDNNNNNTIIICFWIHKQLKQSIFNIYDMNNINTTILIEIYEQMDGNIPNYEDNIEYIQMKIEELNNNNNNKNETIISLKKTMKTYEILLENQKIAINLTYNAFINKTTINNNNNNAIIGNIETGFKIYCCNKVMDRGAVVKCGGECGGKKCIVFKKETKIIRFPKVLIFGIDRYIQLNNSNIGQKFKDIVGYNEFIYFDENKYELYGVCNHIGDLGYGHYWAFIKSIDNNKWYNANDSKITKINNIIHVVNQASAILLFYKKKE